MKREDEIMERIVCLIIGYLCGCFLTADFVSKIYAGKGIPEKGADNPGMASITSKYGIKAGLLVLLGDLLKTFIPCIVCDLWLFKELGKLGAAYVGLGAVLGHCFPIFRHFHGGKGIAVTAAYSFYLSPLVWLITYAIGGAAVLIRGYLAAGSAVIAVLYPIIAFLFGFPLEAIILTVVTGIVILIRHRKNFKAIHEGKERKIQVIQVRGKKKQ